MSSLMEDSGTERASIVARAFRGENPCHGIVQTPDSAFPDSKSGMERASIVMRAFRDNMTFGAIVAIPTFRRFPPIPAVAYDCHGIPKTVDF